MHVELVVKHDRTPESSCTHNEYGKVTSKECLALPGSVSIYRRNAQYPGRSSAGMMLHRSTVQTQTTNRLQTSAMTCT